MNSKIRKAGPLTTTDGAPFASDGDLARWLLTPEAIRMRCGEILAAGKTPDLTVIYDADVLIPLLGLALLALIPVLYKAWKANKHPSEG